MRHTTRLALTAATCVAAIGAASTALANPKTHDGFYLQADLGLGYMSTSADVGGGVKESIYGATLPSALLLGGTIGPVVIGGGLTWDYAYSPGVKIETPAGSASGQATGATLTLVGIGAFADIYPDPTKGLHFQPFVGWGGLTATVNGQVSNGGPTGLVLAAGVGYDWWVSDEWSIGVLGRFGYAPLSQNGVGWNTITPALMASFTYN